jgi:hypothetical protein
LKYNRVAKGIAFSLCSSRFALCCVRASAGAQEST